MHHHLRAGLATGLLLALAAPVAHADVTVRVEGATKTLVSASVPRTGPDVAKSGGTCPGGSSGGALDRAVKGNWAATNYDFGLSVDGIRGETYTFDSGKYWAFDRNNVSSQVGACGDTTADGDEVLFYAACADAGATGCFTGTPLDVKAPGGAQPGDTVTVTVREFDDTKDPAVASPAAGATVTGGKDPATTGADGKARVTLAVPGSVKLVATKGTQVRDEATVDVAEVAATDKRAPRTTIRGIRDGRVFGRAAAPRTLRARVSDASRLKRVELGLVRRRHGRCSALSAAKGRFKRVRCSARPRFRVGAAKRVAVKLRSRLRPGRYVLSVRATDLSGNRERVAGERNRVVFYVR